jgi:hypothetical protein
MKRGAFAQGRSRLIGGLGRGRGWAFRIVALGAIAVLVAPAAAASPAQPNSSSSHLVSQSLSAQLAAVKAEKEGRTPT